MTSALMADALKLLAGGSGGGNGSRDGGAPVVLASAATGIVPFIEKNGGDIDGVFGNSGIAPDMAGAPTLKIKLSSYCRLFEEAAKRTRHGNFGLWFGNQFQPRDLGMWGYAIVSSPTLGTALKNLVDLFPLHQERSIMRLNRGQDGLMRLEYQIYSAEIVERRQDAELSLGMFRNVIRECFGPRWAPLEVHFEHPRPEAWKEHESAFDAPVYFSQPTNALVFRPDLLDRPMPGSDTKLLAMMQTCLESLGSGHEGGDGLFDRIRTAIRLKLANGYPTLDDIAADLRLSPGAIQRELAEHGATYKETVETTRQALARMYLDQRQLPLTEIALLLGYSELSAFTRAFTRWSGSSPSAYRRQGH